MKSENNVTDIIVGIKNICESPCPKGIWQCLESNNCVNEYLVCDGTDHCPFGSDEQDICKQSCFHEVYMY